MDLYEQDVVFVADGDSGNRVIQLPITRIENVEGAIKTVNGVKPDSDGNVNAGLPVGFEYFQTNPNVRSGSLPLTGGTYSRELYPDFWSWIQEQSGYLISESQWQAKASANGGAVPFYSDGDGSTTFRVPALTVWVKGKNGDEAVGDYLADQFKSHKHNVSVSLASDGAHTHTRGTMEITGTLRVVGEGNTASAWTSNVTGTGAFYQVEQLAGTQYYANTVTNTNSGTNYAGFKASKTWSGSTSSEGSHTHTVTLTETAQGGTETRPKTIIGIYCVVAFTTVSTSGSVNLDSLKEAINDTETTIQNAVNETKSIVEAADGFVRCESYGSIRDRDSNKPTYGLS